jgi:hypothetical protein
MATDSAERGYAAIQAGGDGSYIKDSAVTTIANVLHAYGDSWGAKIGDALIDDVFDQARRRYQND